VTGASVPAKAEGGELPPGWAWATLDEVARLGSGGTPKAGVARFYGGAIPWAVIGDLTDGYVSTTSASLTEEGLSESSAKWVPEEAVLIAMYGSIGKLGITSRPLTTNQAIAFAVPDKDLIDTRFLFWYMRSQRTALQRAGRGGTQQNISQTILKPWPIPLPPLTEQRRIVAKLEEYIDRIEMGEAAARSALSRALELAEQVSGQGALGSLDPSENLTSHELAEAGVSDGRLPDLPANWRWRRLGEIADVVGGVTKDSKKQGDPTYVEVPYLRVANVQRGELLLDNVTTIRVPPVKADTLRLKPGDVLLNEGGDRDKLGRGWIWEGQIENCIHQNHVFRARIYGDQLHPKLLAWHANSFGKAWCDRNGSQVVNLASISLRKIKLLPVPVPPRELQDDLVKTVEGHLAAAKLGEQLARDAIASASELRTSLLATAFAGALVPQDEAVEPVNLILNRIRADRGSTAPRTRKRRSTRATSAPSSNNPPDQGEFPL